MKAAPDCAIKGHMHEGAPTSPLPARIEFMTNEASLRGLRCAEALYPAGLRLPRHVHEKPSVTLVAAGSLLELQGPQLRAVACAAGAVVLRPGGEPHGNVIGGRGVVNLELELEPAFLAHYGLAISRPSVLSAAAGTLAHRMRWALCSRERASPLLVEALALELLALVLPERLPAPGRSPWLARVHERIHDEFRSNLTVAALAREAGVHPVHLARAFRAQYGLSPAELVRALRIDWAAQELARGERPIGSIALEAGFYDQSHFTRSFHAAKGAPPGAYRRTRRLVPPAATRS
jgi:AraC family transcriptional regulator